MQEALKAKIKAWLKAQHLSRSWLADRCGVSLKTVNNWLSSPRDIPAKAVLIVERLMETGPEVVTVQSPVPDSVITLRLDEARLDAYTRASAAEGLTLREWAIAALDDAAAQSITAAKEHAPPSAGTASPGGSSPGDSESEVA